MLKPATPKPWPWALFALLGALLGCRSEGSSFLEAPEGAKSALLISRSTTAVALQGLELEGAQRFELDLETTGDGTKVIVLFFEWPAEDLGLGPGPIALAGPDVRGRSIPPDALAMHSSVIEGGALGDWTRLAELGREDQELRLAPIDPASCLARSGCLRSATGRARCERPCPTPALPTAPMPPAPPAPPVFTLPATGLCPVGFAPRPRASFVVCEPLAAAATEPCGPNETLSIGAASCTRVGAPCPSGTLFTPNTGARWFVASGGDDADPGDEQSPLSTVARALALSASGDRIHLAAGDYAEDLIIPHDVEILGACASDTTISGRVTVAADGTLTASDLTISSPTTAVELDSRAGLTGQSLILRSSASRVLELRSGAVSTLRQSVLRGGAQSTIYATEGAVVLDDVALFDATVYGVWVTGTGAHLEARGLVVKGGGTNPSGVPFDKKSAVFVSDAATATLERIFVTERLGTGIHVGRGSNAQLSDGYFRDIADAAVFVAVQSQARLERLYAERVGCASFMASESSRIEGGDLVAMDGVPCGVEQPARGLVAHLASDAVLSRLWVERASMEGVYLENGHVVLEDLTIRDVAEIDQTYPNGSGISVFGADLSLRRAEILRTSYAGIGVLPLEIDAPASLELEDVSIEDVIASRHVDFAARSGLGIFSSGDFSTRLLRLSIHHTEGVAIAITGRDFPPAVDAIAHDLSIEDAEYGLAYSRNVDTTLERVQIRAPRLSGMRMDRGARAHATDLAIQGDDGASTGVWLELLTGAAASSAVTRLDATRFEISGVATGVLAEVDGELHLRDGRFVRTAKALELPATCEAPVELDGVIFQDVPETFSGTLCEPIP